MPFEHIRRIYYRISHNMKYEQNDRYEMTVTEAEYDEDGSLCVSLRFDPHETPALEELLTNCYVKLSVYERDEFTEDGTLALYDRLRC